MLAFGYRKLTKVNEIQNCPCLKKKTIWSDYRGSVVVNGRAYWIDANGDEIKSAS